MYTRPATISAGKERCEHEHESAEIAVPRTRLWRSKMFLIRIQLDYARSKRPSDQGGVIRPPLVTVLDGLENLPADIDPVFVTAEQIVT